MVCAAFQPLVLEILSKIKRSKDQAPAYFVSMTMIPIMDWPPQGLDLNINQAVRDPTKTFIMSLKNPGEIFLKTT